MSRAESRHPAAFPLDDRSIYDAYVAGRQGAALAVGVRVGLFDALDEQPLSASEVAERMGFSARGARSLLVALEAMGTVKAEGERFALTAEAAAYLVTDRPGSLTGLIDLEMEHFLSPAALLEALKKDNSSVCGDSDPWERHEADPEAAARFTAAMHSVSERPAAAFADAAPLSDVTRLLDVGGGSGALSLAVARAHPETRCTVWELESVCDLARGYAERAGLADRVDACTGNMWTEPFPQGYDGVLFSQILHDWSFEEGRVLLAKAFDALESGGHVFVHEKLVDADGGPLANALVNLDMLVWTQGQQYRGAELKTLLEEVGFTDVDWTPGAGYWTVVWARRP